VDTRKPQSACRRNRCAVCGRPHSVTNTNKWCEDCRFDFISFKRFYISLGEVEPVPDRRFAALLPVMQARARRHEPIVSRRD
jgi:hypothetical protein